MKGKFPRWRIDYSLDRYVKRGYLEQDDKELVRIGWRTRAEIDERSLMTLILAQGTQTKASRQVASGHLADEVSALEGLPLALYDAVD